MKIAVIAWQGMVGGATYRWFSQQGYEVMGWSRSSQTHTWEEINSQADYIFICVPTPFDWEKQEYDLTALRETLGKIAPNKVVIHKSTVPPGTTQQLQDEFPNLYLLYNPEFLSEKSCDADFSNPDRQLIGVTDKSKVKGIEVLNILPKAYFEDIMSSTEAEICKLVNNFHGSMMVIFANFFRDVADKTGADYEKIRRAGSASKWVGSSMGRTFWDVSRDGFRGYGGKCFPKDMNMFTKWCKENGVSQELLEATNIANQRILANQGLTEKQAEKMA